MFPNGNNGSDFPDSVRAVFLTFVFRLRSPSFCSVARAQVCCTIFRFVGDVVFRLWHQRVSQASFNFETSGCWNCKKLLTCLLQFFGRPKGTPISPVFNRIRFWFHTVFLQAFIWKPTLNANGRSGQSDSIALVLRNISPILRKIAQILMINPLAQVVSKLSFFSQVGLVVVFEYKFFSLKSSSF